MAAHPGVAEQPIHFECRSPLAQRSYFASSELEAKYRTVDVTQLQRDYVVGSSAARSDSSAHKLSIPGLPVTTRSEWTFLTWPRPGTLVGSYRVSGTRLDRCLKVTVTGPAPNKVDVSLKRLVSCRVRMAAVPSVRSLMVASVLHRA